MLTSIGAIVIILQQLAAAIGAIIIVLQQLAATVGAIIIILQQLAATIGAIIIVLQQLAATICAIIVVLQEAAACAAKWRSASSMPLAVRWPRCTPRPVHLQAHTCSNSRPRSKCYSLPLRCGGFQAGFNVP